MSNSEYICRVVYAIFLLMIILSGGYIFLCAVLR